MKMAYPYLFSIWHIARDFILGFKNVSPFKQKINNVSIAPKKKFRFNYPIQKKSTYCDVKKILKK